MNIVALYILFVCFCLKYTGGEELDVSPKIYEYLKHKSKAVRETVSEKLKTVVGDVEIEEQASGSHISGTYRCTFSLFNETFIILDNQTYRMQTTADNIVLTKFKDLSIKASIQFTKVTQFQDLGLILIKTEMKIDIYGFRNSAIFFMHSIYAPQAADVHFFVNQHYLYLIVINNKGDDMTISSIYKWQGTYFDEKLSILTTGAIKVTSFTDTFCEIIIILRYSPSRELFSSVYEFKFEKIKKIQHIRTINPVSLDIYLTNLAKYVLIFEKSKNNLVLTWDGSKLVPISRFQTDTVINKTVTLTTNNATLLVTPIQGRVQTFRLMAKEMMFIKEINATSNYSKILDIHKESNTSNTVYIIGLNENTLYIGKISFVAHFSDTGRPDVQDTLTNCFHNLQQVVYNTKTTLKNVKQKLRQTRFDRNKDSTDFMAQVTEKNPNNTFVNLKDRLNRLVHILDDYDGNNRIIHQNVIIKGSIEADKLSGENIDINQINGQNWNPQHWLKYKHPQNISGPVKVNNIITNELHTLSSDSLFTDILTKNGDQVIESKFEIVNLTVNKIITQNINDVPVKDIFVKGTLRPAQGIKTFGNLKTIQAKVGMLNKKHLYPKKTPNQTIFSNLVVENLIVNTIDGIRWDHFKNSVFRIGITTEINGDIILPEFKTNNISLKTLKGIRVEDFLTTSTVQDIDADFKFVRIFAENISTNTTNDVNLAKSAVQFKSNAFVSSPVKFDKLYVRENLELIGELDKNFFMKNGKHILGTNESDLLQTYEGVVKIKGNLYVKNITLQPNATLFVGGEEFDPNVRNLYWTKNSKQTIPFHFEAQNGLSVPHLNVNKLNNKDFNQYMLNKDDDRFETNYHFKNVTVLGDVFLAAKGTSNLSRLNQEAVKTNGSYYITGKKIYTDTLRAKHLDTVMLTGAINASKSAVNVSEKSSLKNITITGNLYCNIQSLNFINGFNITNLLNNTIYMNNFNNIEKLHFKNITVEDLWVSKLNNHDVNQHIQNVEKKLVSNKINSLRLIGNVFLNNVTGVSKINNVQFDALLNKTWKHGKSGGVMVNLQFLGPVKIANLVTYYVNDMNLKKLSKRLLYRNIEQNITATYSFKNIKTENLIVSNINTISTDNLIDVSTTTPQYIYAPNGVEMYSALLKKSLNITESSPCDLVTAIKALKNPPTKKWNNVKVKGNATFLDPSCNLFRIFENTVTTNTRNVIQAPVKFSEHVAAKNVIAKAHVNGVNLQEIFDDAVLTNSNEEQVITGRKVFSKLTISSKATVIKNTDIPVINNLDIPVLDKVIVRKSDGQKYVITGNKTFVGGLQCDSLYSEKMSKTDVDNIVNTEKLRKVPSAIFDTFEVDNLNISYINKFDFEGFLKTRLLTKGGEQIVNGVYYFDNIEVEHMEVGSINNITMNNVVFDIGQQNISSLKRFTQQVEVFGNLTCASVNGINLSQLYKQSFQDDDTINGSLTILRPSLVGGSITTEYINGYPVQQIKETLGQGTIRSSTEKIYHIISDMGKRIEQDIHHIKFLASDYMYLEKTRALQISVPNIISATTMLSKGYVLIHVNGEESGRKCGLPEKCKCPVQYSIQISPENSIATFPNKGSQRIFTYNDDEMIVNFLTNSISTSSDCRQESSRVFNEVSMMTWNTLSTKNNSGSFYHYEKYVTGYISGAEFFTFRGETFAIIGRYYDPTTDEHDLDCYLIKFNYAKNNAEEVQRIPTKGAWSIYLFHTAQGVTLVIGNIKKINTHHSEEYTGIYRFNEKQQKFDLLRTVPSYGCSMATGVVLGTDSLIILAHRHAPPQVLKYNPYFSNYYFYQSFELEAPVIGLSVFYTGGFGISDAYLCTVTANENYFIYSFRFIEGWKLESSGELEELRNLIPFDLNKQSYLFAPSSKISSLLSVVKHGSV